MDKQGIKQAFDKIGRFEAQTRLLTFIDIFGSDRGRELWHIHKTKCDYSPTRLKRELSEIERELLFKYISDL